MAAPQAVAPAAPSGKTVRVRNPDELEPAIWDGQRIEVRLRSLESSADAVITFQNASAVPVRAIWLDFVGNEVQYTVIEPGQKRRYRTFVSHPWIIRDVATGGRMMMGTSMVVQATAASEQLAVITAPPALPYSHTTHKCFPAVYKELTKFMLMSHRRLRHGDPADALTIDEPERLLGSSSSCSMLIDSLSAVCPESAMSSCMPSNISSTTCTAIPSNAISAAPSKPSSIFGDVGAMDDVEPMMDQNMDAPLYDTATMPLHTTLPNTPRSRNTARHAAKMLGWVMAKVVRVTSPLRAPRPQAALRFGPDEYLGATANRCVLNPQLFAELPAHLVLDVLAMCAPAMTQCVSLGPTGSPDIKPVLLTSDPATWTAQQPQPAEIPMLQ